MKNYLFSIPAVQSGNSRNEGLKDDSPQEDNEQVILLCVWLP